MKMRITTNLIFTTLLAVFVLAILIAGATYPKEVRLAPWFIGFPTLILIIILWLGDFNPKWKIGGKKLKPEEEAPEAKSEEGDFATWSQALNILCWIFGYFLLIFFLGLFVATPVFLAAFLIKKAGMAVVKAIIVGVVSSAFACYLVQVTLEINLWKGAIPKIIPGILGGGIIPPI